MKKKKYINTRTQDIPRLFHDIGSFYFYKTSTLLNKKKSLPHKTTFLYIDRFNAVDINYLSDLKIAKLKYKLLNKNG